MVYSILTVALYLCLYFVKFWAEKLGVAQLYLKDDRIFTATLVILGTNLFFYKKMYDSFPKKVPFKVLFGFVLLINILLIFLWNTSSNDLYTYIIRARVFAKYGANPYLVPYDKFPHDALVSLKTAWSPYTNTYGPIFVLLSSAISKIAGNSILANVLLFKSVFGAVNIATGLLIYNLKKDARAYFLYSLNPLLIYEISINAHLDILMIFFMVAGSYFIIKKRSWFYYAVSIVLLSAGGLSKYLVMVFSPIWIVFALKNLKGLLQKTKFTILSIALVGSLTIISFWPFWVGPQIFSRVYSVSNAKLLGSAPVLSVIEKLAALFGTGDSFYIAKNVSRGIFYIFYAVTIGKSLFGKLTIQKTFSYSLAVFAMLFLTYLTLVQPWYLTSLIALLCVGFYVSKKIKPSYIYFVTIYGILTYFILR